MYELMVETSFSAAHQLRGYDGRCERLHGHNWRVNIHVTAERLNETGLVIDFHELKRVAEEAVSPLDHSFLNEIFPFTEINPSSENIARWIYDNIKKRLSGKNVDVSMVTVWESETASATYME